MHRVPRSSKRGFFRAGYAEERDTEEEPTFFDSRLESVSRR